MTMLRPSSLALTLSLLAAGSVDAWQSPVPVPALKAPRPAPAPSPSLRAPAAPVAPLPPVAPLAFAAPARPMPAAPQQPAPPSQPAPQAPPQPQTIVMPRVSNGPLIPLQVDVTIARYQGDKRVSSMPYALAVNANGDRAQLNMGAEVPVPNTMFAPVAGGPAPGTSALRSFSYKTIGTNILCDAKDAPEGRFEVSLQIDDSSVYSSGTATGTADTPIVGEMPVFRSFKSRNTLLLRDGQSRQYTAATDRVSGETVRIEVALKVVK
jgi:hypothetical protein